MSPLPKTMLAWQKQAGITEPVRNEIAIPSASPDGLLIKIHAAGVCHSDVVLLKTEVLMSENSNASTLGHEGAGVIVEVGSAVTGFKVGERVAIHPVAGCKSASCGECSRDLAQICRTGEKYGIGSNGSYAPYIAIKAHHAVKLPDNVSFAQGAVATDACMTAYHAVVGTGGAKKDETVLLVGIGGLGFNALQILQTIGTRMIVADKRQEVLDEAIKFGVPKEDVVPAGESVSEFVKKNNLVIDTVFDFAGVQETFDASQEAVRFGGKLVQVGLLAPSLTIGSLKAARRHLSILFSYGGTMADLEQCLTLISEGKLRPQVVTGSLDDFPKILEELHEGKVKSRIALIPKL